MARKRNDEKEEIISFGDQEIYQELKSVINKQIPGSAFILGDDDAPNIVNEFISLGSYQLDTIISNKPDKGGAPVGRITEISGLNSSGKSLLAIEACRDTQRKGGICLYIDTENATSLEWLVNLGLDPKRLVYIQVQTTEEVFSTIESVVSHLLERYKGKKNRPIITIVWDSVAQTSTQSENEGGYGDMQMASQAKVIGKGIRKITQFLGASNVCFIILNQLKMKMNVPNKYSDPYVTSGGLAIPYAASVRIRLAQKSKIEGDNEAVIGYETEAKIVKNKVGPPARKCTFDILFNSGVSDDEQALDFLKKHNLIEILSSQRSALILENGDRVEFKNKEWETISAEHKEYISKLIRQALVVDMSNPEMQKTRVALSPEEGGYIMTDDGEKLDVNTGEIVEMPHKNGKMKKSFANLPPIGAPNHGDLIDAPSPGAPFGGDR